MSQDSNEACRSMHFEMHTTQQLCPLIDWMISLPYSAAAIHRLELSSHLHHNCDFAIAPKLKLLINRGGRLSHPVPKMNNRSDSTHKSSRQINSLSTNVRRAHHREKQGGDDQEAVVTCRELGNLLGGVCLLADQ